jgi:hypothetical protein
MHDPDVVTEHPDVAQLIDFDHPAAVMFVAVLHFSAGDEPRRIVEHFTRRMVPGSYLVISAGSSENLSDAELNEIHAAYARTPRGGHLRCRARSRRCSRASSWSSRAWSTSAAGRGFERPTHVSILAGVARRIDDASHGDGRADGTPPPT